MVPYKIAKADNGDAWVEVHGKKMAPPEDLGARAHEDEEDGRGLSRRDRDRSRHHGARLFQRFAAPGDQGRRPHRGPERQAHHQRADRGCARLWPRQAGRRPQDRGLRPGRRHVRYFHHRDRRGRRRAPVRSARRPTATRSSAAKTSTSASSTTSPRSSRRKAASTCGAIRSPCSA